MALTIFAGGKYNKWFFLGFGCFCLMMVVVIPTKRYYRGKEKVKAEADLARALAKMPTAYDDVDNFEDDYVVGEYKGDESQPIHKKRMAHRKPEGVKDESLEFSPVMANNPLASMSKVSEAKKGITKYRPNLAHLTDLPIKEAYEALVNEYLAPWNGLTPKGFAKVPITKKMLNLMEYAYKGGSFRVRIVDGKIYYRKIVHWKQTYRTQRMAWYLKLLHEMVRRDRMVTKDVDFILYVGDGAKVAADTFTVEAGLPLFSLRSSPLHMDIPVPDPVSHGSNGRYQWNDAGKAIAWETRVSQLVFRGKGSCLKMQADNWHACNRVRAQKLAQAFPEEIDAGIIEWNQLHKASKMIYPPVTPEEVERSTGLKTVKPLDFIQQSHYKYILDLDGGLGSSRKPGILSSGSVLFSQDSPWYTYYEPLLEPYKHYVPVDRWLRDLREQVVWARNSDDIVKKIMENGRVFEEKYLTIASTKLYMSILLDKYADLLAEPINGSEPVERDYCQLMDNFDVQNGPMGCSREWLLFTGELPDEIRLDGKDEPGKL
jgi:hypothetical protein